jgi:hypothetical protein
MYDRPESVIIPCEHSGAPNRAPFVSADAVRTLSRFLTKRLTSDVLPYFTNVQGLSWKGRKARVNITPNVRAHSQTGYHARAADPPRHHQRAQE